MRTRFCPVALLAVMLAVAGCNSNPDPETTVSGSASGVTFNNPVAVFNHVGGQIFGNTTQVLVLISDDPNGCADALVGGEIVDPGFGSGKERNRVGMPDGGVWPSLFFQMQEGADVYDGDYLSSGRTLGQDLHASFDPGCSVDPVKELSDGGEVSTAPCTVSPAISGSGKFNGDSSSLAQGSFNLGFSEGGNFSGTFHATPCTTLGVNNVGCGSAPGDAFPALISALMLGGLRRTRRRTSIS